MALGYGVIEFSTTWRGPSLGITALQARVADHELLLSRRELTACAKGKINPSGSILIAPTKDMHVRVCLVVTFPGSIAMSGWQDFDEVAAAAYSSHKEEEAEFKKAVLKARGIAADASGHPIARQQPSANIVGRPLNGGQLTPIDMAALASELKTVNNANISQ